MKKILAIILTVFTVANLFCFCVPASADAVAPMVDINDNLVVHYDFEGSTTEEKLSDKAPQGTADNLSEWKGNAADAVGGKIVYDNGTVKATADGGYLHTENANGDISALGGQSTIFVRYKIPSYSTNIVFADVYNKTISIRQAQVGVSGANKDATNVIGGYGVSTGNKYLGYGLGSANALAYRVLDTYVNIAIVYNPTKTVSSETDGVKTYTGEITYYASVGMPGDWFRLGTKTPTNTSDTLSEASDTMRLSILNNVSGGNTKEGLVIDDFRIYNTMLNTDQLTSIIDTGSFDCKYNTMEVVGMQIAKKAESTNYSVRFIGTIDKLDADYVGFKVKAVYGNNVESFEKTYTTTTVYTSIIADDETVTPYTEWQSKYVVVLPINNIPDSYGDVTFTITPITVDGETVSGATQTYTVNAGVEVK